MPPEQRRVRGDEAVGFSRDRDEFCPTVWNVPILEGHVVLLCRQLRRCLTSGCKTAAVSLFLQMIFAFRVGVFMLLSLLLVQTLGSCRVPVEPPLECNRRCINKV